MCFGGFSGKFLDVFIDLLGADRFLAWSEFIVITGTGILLQVIYDIKVILFQLVITLIVNDQYGRILKHHVQGDPFHAVIFLRILSDLKGDVKCFVKE